MEWKETDEGIHYLETENFKLEVACVGVSIYWAWIYWSNVHDNGYQSFISEGPYDTLSLAKYGIVAEFNSFLERERIN